VRGASSDNIDVGGINTETSKFQAFMASASYQYHKFMRLSERFLPMVALFFLMAFVNTILDSLKDTLVITAVGGGPQVGRVPMAP
jgi:AAA family ATP:ADP antiporter